MNILAFLENAAIEQPDLGRGKGSTLRGVIASRIF
jgi:hypothetical protein